MAGSCLLLGLGEIQEAIFEEKIFRIFFTQKKVFFLATKYKQDYIWISYWKIVYRLRNDDRF